MSNKEQEAADRRVVAYSGNKKSFTDDESLKRDMDCDTVLRIEIDADRPVTQQSIKVYCPGCGEKHRFTINHTKMEEGAVKP